MASAESLNYGRSVFDTPVVDGLPKLDRLWSLYEDKLPEALGRLTLSEGLPWQYVLQTVVPFVAGVAVRSPTFDDWYRERLPLMQPSEFVDKVNYERMRALYTTAGRLLTARWDIIAAPVGQHFILNDLGYCGFTSGTAQQNYRHMFVPLRLQFGLLLTVDTHPRMWQTTAGGRVAVFGRRACTPEQVARLNHSMALMAKREIYGRRQSDVDEVGLEDTAPLPHRLADLLGTSWNAQADMDHYWIQEMKRAECKASSYTLSVLPNPHATRG